MSWRDNLRPASFRGVGFFVNGAGLEGGRRQQVHTFPGRDKPYVEDLGKKAREFKVEGFVLGQDYMAERNAVLDACETAGPGHLVHPYLGSLTVSCLGVAVQESKTKGGLATFTFSFIESGEALHPTSALDTGAIVTRCADEAVDVSGVILDETVDYSGASFVLESMLEAVQVAADTVLAGRTEVADLASFTAQAELLQGLDTTGLAGLESLGAQLAPLFQDADPDNLLDHARRASELLDLSTSFPLPSLPSRLTPSRLLEQSNLAACADFSTRLAVAELARSAAGVVPESVRAATQLRNQVTGAIDTVLERTESDDIFTAFTSLRAATVRDLAERAKLAPKVASVVPRLTDTVLTLAHQAHDSIGQAEDIITRNTLRHPGFPGMDALEVLRG